MFQVFESEGMVKIWAFHGKGVAVNILTYSYRSTNVKKNRESGLEMAVFI